MKIKQKPQLTLSFDRINEGKTFIKKQFSSYPFHICKALYLDKEKTKDMASIYMQSSSGGLYQEDLLDSEIFLSENTKVHITSQASTIVHETKNKPAKQHTNITCNKNSYLEYMPEPMIMLPNSSLETKINIKAHENSQFIITDSFFPHNYLKKEKYFNFLENEIIIENQKGNISCIDRFIVNGNDFLKKSKKDLDYNFLCHGTVIIYCPSKNYSTLLKMCKDVFKNKKNIFGSASNLPDDIGIYIKILTKNAIDLKKSFIKIWKKNRLFLFTENPSIRKK